MGINSREFYLTPGFYTGSPYVGVAADMYDWIRLAEHERPAAANRLLRNMGAIFIPGSQGMKEAHRLSDHWGDGEYLDGLAHLIGTLKSEQGKGKKRHERLFGVI